MRVRFDFKISLQVKAVARLGANFESMRVFHNLFFCLGLDCPSMWTDYFVLIPLQQKSQIVFALFWGSFTSPPILIQLAEKTTGGLQAVQRRASGVMAKNSLAPVGVTSAR